MPRLAAPCAVPACPNLMPCPDHSKARRRTPSRGYGPRHRRVFRAGVLFAADYTCAACGAEATEADHWPRTRDQLVAAGEDHNDPAFGRALCKPCHSRHTAATRSREAGGAFS